MNQEHIRLTLFDQMINSDQSQMIKALLPYFPSDAQQMLGIFTKVSELMQTIHMFQNSSSKIASCDTAQNQIQPLELLDELRSYCYGNTRQSLEQLSNLFALTEMIKIMNEASTEPANVSNEKEEETP